MLCGAIYGRGNRGVSKGRENHKRVRKAPDRRGRADMPVKALRFGPGVRVIRVVPRIVQADFFRGLKARKFPAPRPLEAGARPRAHRLVARSLRSLAPRCAPWAVLEGGGRRVGTSDSEGEKMEGVKMQCDPRVKRSISKAADPSEVQNASSSN